MSRRPRVVAAILLALVFGVGGLAGMAVEEGLGLDWFDFLDEDEEIVDDRIFAGLELTDEQTRQIDDILDAQEETLEEYWQNRVPELREIVADADDRIRMILTPEQRAIFDSRVEARGTRIPDGPD